MQTDIDSQPKKSSSRKKNSTGSTEIVSKIAANAWWPFDRVDGKILEQLHRKELKRNQEEALI